MWLIRNKDKSTLSDEELILQFRNSDDKQAIGDLFNRYSHLVFGVCMKYLKDAEESQDAVMQIFEKLYVDLKKHEVNKFSYWIHRVAQNFCLMQLRSKKAAMNRTVDFYLDEKAVMETEEESHLTTAMQKETELNKLQEAIQSLDTEQKICVELFYIKEKCYNDICELTGFDYKQVKSYIQNGKRNLKIYLEQNSHAH